MPALWLQFCPHSKLDLSQPELSLWVNDKVSFHVQHMIAPERLSGSLLLCQPRRRKQLGYGVDEAMPLINSAK
jgi:hypothetical protein